METLLGIIMILSPLWVLTNLWIPKLHKKMWVKVSNTVLLVVMFICVIALGTSEIELETTKAELKDVEASISYVVDRDTRLLDCLDNQEGELFDMIDYCVIPNVKQIRKIYDRE